MKNMDRRNFLTLAASFAAYCRAGESFSPPGGSAAATSTPMTFTVDGVIETRKLGNTLMHEHLWVDFIGADQITRDRYDPEEVFRTALPYLKRVYELGCRTFVDCTPAWLGRDPRLLLRLSKASRMRIITNTGYYGAANDKYVPKHAFSESAEQLAARWTLEFKGGIEDTGIRPGFIKIGVDRAPLSEIDSKLVRAAALTHRATGLTIASHTGNGPAALEQLEILRREGVSPSAFIWVHAQNEGNLEIQEQIASQGAWVEFDGIRDTSLEKHRDFVRQMKGRGRLGQVLISQDAGWYRIGEPKGGNFRDYNLMFTRFIPALREIGFSKQQVRQLIVENPSRALAVQLRLL